MRYRNKHKANQFATAFMTMAIEEGYTTEQMMRDACFIFKDWKLARYRVAKKVRRLNKK